MSEPGVHGLETWGLRCVHLAPDRGLKWVDDRTIVGGSPPRRLKLSPRGADRLRELLDGATPGPAEGEFIRGLLAAGVVHPLPACVVETSTLVTIVIPFHGDPGGLGPLLEALPTDTDVILVDDHSPDPVRGDAPNVKVIRHASNRGPSAARNTGWRLATTPYVVFLDADTQPTPTWYQRLIGHFFDERIAVVAPRIRSVPGPRALSRFEAVCNPLDMGPVAGLVRRWSRLPYVPSAAWVARRKALEDVGGFNEDMRLAEDVDLVWRLEAHGWRVRYEPTVEVLHQPRDSWPQALRQRHQYGRSSARLWRDHPRRFRHLEVMPHAVIPWLVGAGIGPAAGAVASVTSVGSTIRRGQLAPMAAARVALQTQWRTGGHLGDYVRRVALPLVALAAAAGSRASRRTLIASLTPYLVEWISQRPRIDVLRYAAFRLADDLAYGSGVWRGSAEVRSPGPMSIHLIFWDDLKVVSDT